MTESAQLTVLQMGPGLAVRGGISAVERLILEHVGSRIAMAHVATMEEVSLLRRIRVFARSVSHLARAMRVPGPLLVHIHFASRGSTLRKMLLAWMILRAGKPLVMHAHGGGFDSFYARLPPSARRAVARVLQRCDCVIVLSQQWREFYIAHCAVPEARVKVLYNPACLPEQVPDRRRRATVQFLFLGRIGASKGAFDLLNAFDSLAPSERRRARLVMAGDGDLAAIRRSFSSADGQPLILSWVDSAQRDALLAESDVFILPSYREGVPMALLEAMAFGLPVITTPVGGIPDIVTDRREGLLVSPGDVPRLRQAMSELIQDNALRFALGRAARERARHFDVAQYASELLALYRRLATTAG